MRRQRAASVADEIGPAREHFAAWQQAAGGRVTEQGAGSTCILIRTHYSDPLIGEFAARLRHDTGWPVYLVLDETKGPADPAPGEDRISLTYGLFEAMGLYSTPDIGWRCGDYALYAARKALPDVTYFWMIEPDVRIGLQDLGDFFGYFAAHPDYDLLATYYGAAGPEYQWTAMIAPFAAHPKKCMFPIVRFSARALDYLLLRRRLLSEAFWSGRYTDGRLRSLEIWPNDEVFTATMLHEGGFRAADLNATGREFYDSQSFSYAYPISLQRFNGMAADGRIYHPVLASGAFLRKIRSMFEHVRLNAGPASLMRGLFDRQDLYDDIRAECGDGDADSFAADVRAALDGL